MNFQAYNINQYPEWACIHIKTPESASRVPVHLCCIIDTSYSMNNNDKLNNVKKSLYFLLDFLGPQDMVSIVTFNSVAHVIINKVFVTLNEKENIRTHISTICATSNTNLSSGIIAAYSTLLLNTTNIKQGIVILTDGIANVGLTNPTDIMQLINTTTSTFNNTSISCIGYGLDHNIELLQNISSASNGSSYVVNNLENVAVVFGDILGSIVSCFAQQVHIILPPNTEIKSRYAVTSIPYCIDVMIGDVISGTDVSFLVKIPQPRTRHNTNIILKGYNILTQSPFELNTHIIDVNDAKLQTNGKAQYLRFEVVTLLEKTRLLLSTNSLNDNEVTTLTTYITYCMNTVIRYQEEHAHPLWNVLLKELVICKEMVHTHYNQDDVHIISQHQQCLSVMRGIPAMVYADRNSWQSHYIRNDMVDDMVDDTVDDTVDDIDDNSHTILTAFSNSTQRQISTQLRTSVTPLRSNNTVCIPFTQDPTQFYSSDDVYQ